MSVQETGTPLEAVKVIGIRCRGRRFAPEGQGVLDACVSEGAYEAADVPFEVTEPRIPEFGPDESEPVTVKTP